MSGRGRGQGQEAYRIENKRLQRRMRMGFFLVHLISVHIIV